MKWLALLLLLLPNLASAALTDNLVSYWKFDEASGNAADSVGSNTLTNTNTATFNTGKLNNSCYLADASDQYFEITDGTQSGLDLSGDFTISGWIYRNSIADYPILGKDASAGSLIQYAIFFGGGTLIMDLSQDGTQTSNKYHRQGTSAAVMTSSGTWYFMTMTYVLSTNTLVIYVDGSVAASTQSYGTGVTSIYNGTGPFNIGRLAWAYGATTFDGRIDDVGIWSRALSGAEITELYNAGVGLQYPFVSPATFSLWVMSLF